MKRRLALLAVLALTLGGFVLFEDQPVATPAVVEASVPLPPVERPSRTAAVAPAPAPAPRALPEPTPPAPAPAPAPAPEPFDASAAPAAVIEPPPAPTPDPPAPPDAGPEAPPLKPERNDRRFTVRWTEGLCGERSLAELRTSRDQLLGGFIERRIGEAVVLHDPHIDGATLARLSLRLLQARTAVGEWIDWPSNASPPVMVVYRSSQQLRGVACASAQTVGYYDGRLHVSVDDSLTEALVDQTVTHEYVHFALNTLGIPRPMWLHEGLAMHVAEESWFTSSQLDLARWLRTDHLPFEAMVFAFPHTADEKFALAAYFQSYRMVDFVQALRGPTGTRELVRRLTSGTTSQSDAFAVGAGLAPSDLEGQWQHFTSTQ